MEICMFKREKSSNEIKSEAYDIDLTVRGREEEMSQLFEKIGTKRVT
jgi:hypothetical protein